MNRQAFAIVVGAEVTVQRRLGLGADPAPHAVAADQQDEAAAGLESLLQAVELEIARADAFLVAKHLDARILQLVEQAGRRLPVVAAVAQENMKFVGHPAVLRGEPGNLTG
jgi:dihydroorotase